MSQTSVGAPRPLYAVSIHHCIAQGELVKMKALVQEAEDHLRNYGDVRTALEALKIEIAKLEKS